MGPMTDDAAVEEGEAPAQSATPKNPMPEDQAGDERVMRVVLAAKKVMYGNRQTSDGVVRMLKGGEPAQALMQTAIMVLRILFNESKEKMPHDVLLAAVEPVVAELVELAEAVGMAIDPNVVAQVTEQVKATIQQKLQGNPQPAPQAPPPGAQQQPAGGGLIQQAMGG